MEVHKCISKDVNSCVSSFFPAAKPLHHHGQECLRLRVDVVAADGEFNCTPGLKESSIMTPDS